MTLFIIVFLAGMLTVLAPCILPLLPVIIGGSVADEKKRNPLVITASLAAAIILFTLILKFSTVFINVPQKVWEVISGVIVAAFGLVSLFPNLWEQVAVRFNWQGKSTALLTGSVAKQSRWGDVLLGMSLGPVFSSCSPTYFLILATILPQSFGTGLLYLIVYALGLSVVLLLIAYIGQKFVRKIQWLSDPRGWFKRGLGVLFIVVGLAIMTGTLKQFQTYLISRGWYDITKVELKLLETGNIQ